MYKNVNSKVYIKFEGFEQNNVFLFPLSIVL
jgi:hypothetical protein